MLYSTNTLKDTMSHSFYEVIPYLLTEGYNSKVLDTDLLQDILQDEDKVSDIEDMFYDLTNPAKGDVLNLDLPAFTGVHFETQEERTFEAKSFCVTIVDCDESMDSCSEGKTEYGHAIHLVDNDSGEKMYAWTAYYAAVDRFLTDFGIMLEDETTEKKEPTLFVLVEDMHYEGFIVHGMFDSLDKAVTQIKHIQAQDIYSCKNVIIEEVPMNIFNVYDPNTDYSRSLIRGSVAKYQADGTLIEKF